MSHVQGTPTHDRWMSREDIIRDFGVDIAARRHSYRSAFDRGCDLEPQRSRAVVGARALDTDADSLEEQARQILAALLSQVGDERETRAHMTVHRSGNPAITPLCRCDTADVRGPRARLLRRLLHTAEARQA